MRAFGLGHSSLILDDAVLLSLGCRAIAAGARPASSTSSNSCLTRMSRGSVFGEPIAHPRRIVQGEGSRKFRFADALDDELQNLLTRAIEVLPEVRPAADAPPSRT